MEVAEESLKENCCKAEHRGKYLTDWLSITMQAPQPSQLQSSGTAQILLSAVFHALADPTRRAIVRELDDGTERLVSELAQPFQMSLPAVSKHLRVLEKADLIQRRRSGRHHFLRLNPKPLQTAHEWLSFHQKFWEEKLDALVDYLETEAEPGGSGFPEEGEETSNKFSRRAADSISTGCNNNTNPDKSTSRKTTSNNSNNSTDNQ